MAPVLVNFDVWDIAYVPADIVLKRGKIYDVSCTAFKEDDGTEICKITVTGDSGIVSRPVLEGSLYVDRKKCRLLHFDGQMRGLYLRAYDQARRRITTNEVQYTMHVDYRHDHGFTEIANLSGTIVRDKVMVRYLLFNLGDKELTFKKSVRVENNMLQTIDKVGFDSTLWDMTGIVKRTQQEERVAFQDSTFRMPDRSKYNVAPTVQELNRLCTSSDDLASYMCPRYYAFVDELPRNATGKKLHVRLREQAARDLAEGRLARP